MSMMKNTYLEAAIDRLQHHAAWVQEYFGQLSSAQLNWKARPESWSIGQCLDHLITTNSTYFPVLKSIGTGGDRMGWWARISPLSNFFGDLLLRGSGPVIRKKAKSPKVFAPRNSMADPAIVQRFQQHKNDLIDLLIGADSIQHDTFKISSPAAAMITYRLDIAVQIIVEHEERHILQAVQVQQTPGFPKA
jgi:hypothetical protein